ncbi:stromal cell-derived factor 2 [Neodiprion virginianus]|uniref:stromal cell-derived factor 2 n=1 Tax=Neodiprion virginianus TaxID=2961670 RepID=UPI001EE703E7|nr:stromal cell-derived factor 2 [Neodiprion virginianus]
MSTQKTNLLCCSLLYFTIPWIIVLNAQNVYAKGTNYVTCGSVLKLLNIGSNVRLHSHSIKYGTGSGQQSVTATEIQEDGNSHWLVKAETGKQCIRGKPIKCGDIVRLEHLSTKKNLHSHHFSSPLSGNQEISAYGDEKGEGDTGDDWLVVCQSEFWERDNPIMLKHIDTNVYLSSSERTYGNPITGQVEVVGMYTPMGDNSNWKSMEGLFIHPSDFKAQHTYQHTEL